MKIIIKILVILVGIIIIYEAIHLIWQREVVGWAFFSWMEQVAEGGPSASAAPEDVGSIEAIKSFNWEKSLPLQTPPEHCSCA